MENAIVTRREAATPVAATPASPPTITACGIAGMAVGMLVVGIVLSQIPDLIRYFRMSNM
ncbi:MAG: DUF6893 family small protein [Thiohalocapsa sp.]